MSANKLAEFEAWLDNYLSGYDLDEQERILRIALDNTARCAKATYQAPPSPSPIGEAGSEAVAVVGSGFQLLWTGGESFAEHAHKHGIKVGTKLYTPPPQAERGTPQAEPAGEAPEQESPPWREEILDRFDEFADESADGVFDEMTAQAALWIIDTLNAQLKEHGMAPRAPKPEPLPAQPERAGAVWVAFEAAKAAAIESGAHESYGKVRDAFDRLQDVITTPQAAADDYTADLERDFASLEARHGVLAAALQEIARGGRWSDAVDIANAALEQDAHPPKPEPLPAQPERAGAREVLADLVDHLSIVQLGMTTPAALALHRASCFLVRTPPAAAQLPEPVRCPEKLKTGHCQLHNLQCGWPKCNLPTGEAKGRA
jgi:hypothetical protein